MLLTQALYLSEKRTQGTYNKMLSEALSIELQYPESYCAKKKKKKISKHRSVADPDP
jgi:hypothetical protein